MPMHGRSGCCEGVERDDKDMDDWRSIEVIEAFQRTVVELALELALRLGDFKLASGLGALAGFAKIGPSPAESRQLTCTLPLDQSTRFILTGTRRTAQCKQERAMPSFPFSRLQRVTVYN
jgi:hypothetical protein